MKEQHIEWETRCAVSSKHIQMRDFARFSFLLQLDRLQLTAVRCNRRECEQHTSHVAFFSLIDTHMRGSTRVFVVRTSCVILMCLF